jgi:serine O-acetyltransferase
MEASFINQLFQSHQQAPHIPEPSLVCNWLEQLLGILFPEFSNHRYGSEREFAQHFREIELELNRILLRMETQLPISAEATEVAFIKCLPTIRKMLVQDANAILKGDPAAVSITEVIRTYPGFFAIAVYRLAHEFHQLRIPLIPRILTESAHSKTGIDIHPGASIGVGLCIDHGSGVVIGETCEIGDNVKIYQGVTLGALSVRKTMAKTKRHPTIQDNVVIYSGATILGGETIIGEGSIIGGNVWLTKSVPAQSRIYYTAFAQAEKQPKKELASNYPEQK